MKKIKPSQAPQATFTFNQQIIHLVKDGSHVRSTYKTDESIPCQSEDAQDEHDNERLQLSTIYSVDKNYIVNNTQLAIKTIGFLKKHTIKSRLKLNPGISINEPSGSGKTCFLECMEELSELDKNNVHYKLADSLGLIEEATEVFDNVLVMNITFKDVMKRVSTIADNIEANFILHLSFLLIKQLEMKIQIVNKRDGKCDNSFLENYKTHLSQKISAENPKIGLEHQIQEHKTILLFIMQGITEGIIYKRQKHLEGKTTKKQKLSDNSIVRINNKPYKKIEKAVLLIDEVNIFKSKEIYSNTVEEGCQHRNFYLQIVEDAMKMDTKRQSTLNLAYMFSSISPLSKERQGISSRMQIFDFIDILSRIGEESFSEVSFGHFYRISKENDGTNERKTHPNKLQILIDELKQSNMAIVNYFDKKENVKEKELDEKIKEIFAPDYHGTIESDLENEILVRIYTLFNFLFGQPYFSVKHSYSHMIDCAKNILSSEEPLTEILSEKLNTFQFLNFLMHPKKEGSISLYTKQNPSTESNMESFWHDYHIFLKRSKYQFPFRIPIAGINTLYGPIGDVPRHNEIQTIYNTFHYGYTSLTSSTLYRRNPVLKLGFTNYQQKINLQRQYKKYLDRKEPEKLFSYTEKGLLKETFTLTFWRDTIMPRIRKCVTNVMQIKSVSKIDENVFRDATGDYLNEILSEEIKKKCDTKTAEKMKDFFQVRPEVRMNKRNSFWQKTENARIDLLVFLNADNDEMSKCVVIMELKINNGIPKNLGTLTTFDKNYQTLDLDMFGHTIYVSASLNKKGFRCAKKATRMESFTDNKI